MKRNKFLTSFLALPFISLLDKKAGYVRREWKKEDIIAGLYVTRNYPRGMEWTGLSTITYQIGYSFAMGRHKCQEISIRMVPNENHRVFLMVDKSSDSKSHYTLNSVADGWSHGDINMQLDQKNPFLGYTKEDLCYYLNKDEHGYRPTTKEEMHAIIDHTRKNFLCT